MQAATTAAQDLASAEIYHPWSQSFEAVDTKLSVAAERPRGGSAAVEQQRADRRRHRRTASRRRLSDLFLPAEFPDPYLVRDGAVRADRSMAAPRVGAAGGPHVEGYAFAMGGGAADAEVYRFATIKTDKDDYAPGEMAIITGQAGSRTRK